MFTKITEKIVGNMEKHNMIQTDRISIYKYGINQMLNMLLNIVTFLVIGLIFHMTLETIIFTAAYIPLRTYAGGFHAKTPFKCWIVSAVMLIAVLPAIKYANLYIFDILALAGIAVIIILSPVEDKNKPLDELEKKVYKKRCLLTLAAELFIFVLLWLFRMNNLSVCFEAVWITLSVMLIAGKIKNIIINHNR